MFPNSHLRGLGSDASDHCPVLLQTNLGRKAKARFHFESYWPKFDDFDDILVQAWIRPQSVHDPLHRLNCMLRAMAKSLQRWSATRIGEIREQLLMAHELVLCLDIA